MPTATKVRISEVTAGQVIEFHGVRPSYNDSKVGPVLTWEQVPAKTPLTVTSVEVTYNTSAGVGGMSKSGNREYVITFDSGRSVNVSNQQKVVVR